MTTIVSVTERIRNSTVHSGDDVIYRDILTQILREIVTVAGAIVAGADYPVFAQGESWRFKFGVPRDGQEHYIEFDREADAVFYVLKHGGEIVGELEEVEIAWAK
jgi:hypothetical protein